MPRHEANGDEQELRRWLAEAGLPPAPDNLEFDWARWEAVKVPRPRRWWRWKAMAGAVALLLVAASIYHFRIQAASPASNASATPAATVNEFLSEFIEGHLTQAAQLTTEGSRAAEALAADQRSLEALLVNQAPFAPIAALHWTTHCSSVACETTFASLDHHVVYPFDVRLDTVDREFRVPIDAVTIWLQALGRGTMVSPSLTWQQARRDGPSWVRKPTWLPAGVSPPQLVQGPVTGSLVASYAGPHNSWTLQINEWAGPVSVSNPNETTSSLAGIAVTISQWHSTSGTPLNDVVFHLNGHEYEVLGINVPLAVVEHVAASLIRH